MSGGDDLKSDDDDSKIEDYSLEGTERHTCLKEWQNAQVKERDSPIQVPNSTPSPSQKVMKRWQIASGDIDEEKDVDKVLGIRR